MYLHLGQDTVVRHEDIIAICDIESSSVSKITRKFLETAEKEKRVVNVTSELPKSFIVCAGRNSRGATVYISQISSTTLLKRSNFLAELSKDEGNAKENK